MNGFVHYGLTKRWAIEAGFDPESAEVIARANIDVDRKFPGRHWRFKRYHFAWLGARRIAREWLGEALETGDLVALGQAMHCVQDAVSHGNLGHIVHWPGIDIWERRTQRAQGRIEQASREMLAQYREVMLAREDDAGEEPGAASEPEPRGQDIL